jgi:hypothetical protein
MRETQTAHFDNEGYRASLEGGELCSVIPAAEAAAYGRYIRVADERGEDYAFLSGRFHPVELSQAVERTLLAASQP